MCSSDLPSLTHRFIRLLERKGKLLCNYTQVCRWLTIMLDEPTLPTTQWDRMLVLEPRRTSTLSSTSQAFAESSTATARLQLHHVCDAAYELQVQQSNKRSRARYESIDGCSALSRMLIGSERMADRPLLQALPQGRHEARYAIDRRSTVSRSRDTTAHESIRQSCASFAL